MGNYEFAPTEEDGADDDKSEEEEDPLNDDASNATPVNEENEDDHTVNEENDNGVSDDENNDAMQQPTESDAFRTAELQGRERAAQVLAGRPRRVIRPVRYDDFTYTFFEHMRKLQEDTYQTGSSCTRTSLHRCQPRRD